MARQVWLLGGGVLLDLGDHGVDAGCGCFADAEFAEGGADVVLDGTQVRVEGGGGAGSVGDLILELGDPEVEEVVDLVHGGELSAMAGLGAVLEFLEQGTLGGGRGFAVGGHVSDLAVVVAEVGLRADARGLAVVVGLHDLGGDPSPGADGQRWSRHLKPPTCSMVGCSTPGSEEDPAPGE